MELVFRLIRWSFHGNPTAVLLDRFTGPSVRCFCALVVGSLLAACDVVSPATEADPDDVPPPPAAAGIVILPLEVVLDEGATSQLRVFERAADGGAGREITAVTTLTWRTSEGVVATVAAGLVQAAQMGAAQITVTTPDGRSASSDVRVVREPARLEIVSGRDQIARVMSALDSAVVVRVLSKLGRPVEGISVAFIPSGGGRVSEANVPTGPDGLARTVWTLGPIAGSQTLELRAGSGADLNRELLGIARPGPAAVVSVQPESIALWAGTSMQLDFLALDAYGNRIENVPVIWEMADPTIAEVTSTGKLTGLRLGTTEVFATVDESALSPNPGVEGVALAPSANNKGKGTVTVGGPETFSISVGGNNQTGEVGTRLTNPLRLKVVDASGRAVNQLAVSWVVTSGGGSVSPTQSSTNGTGQTEAYWTLGGVTGAQTLEARVSGRAPIRFSATAVAGALAKIEIRPTAAQVKAGETFQYQAIGTDRFGNAKTVTFFWSVVDASVATVSSVGLAKGLKASSTLVRATSGSISAAADLAVVQAGETTNAAPVASFTSSCTQLTCTFTDASTDSDGQITARSWSFGDGGSATSATVTRSYAIAGTYTVTLQVTDDKGASSSTSKSVTVGSSGGGSNAAPVASFTYSCTELACGFTDTSTDADGQISSRAWAFGDGGTSTSANPGHTYAAAGTYSVTLTVKDDKGTSASKSQSVTVSKTVTQPPPTGSWNRVIQDTIVQGNLVVPAGQQWLIGRNVQVAGNVLVKDATLAMRAGSSLKFLGANAASYVGGGMNFEGGSFQNDIGLWVWGSGQLDIACTPKTGWNRSGTDPSWLSTDEYWISPTAAGDFMPRRWSPGQAIPRMDPRVPSAEVINVTRDCTITGPGHIHVNSTRSQRVEYVRLQSMGIANSKFFKSPFDDPAISGRYALHLHMSGEGTRGTIVRGVAAVDSRGKVFVPHSSHGVTMVDNVSVNSWSTALWWDEGHTTNDLVVDRLAVAGVALPWEVLGRDWSNKPGVALAEGVNMEIRNSVVAGVRGWESYAGGFDWIHPITDSPRHWIFKEGNVSHNNDGSGLRFWTNLTDPHYTANFVSYRNRTNGIEAGAYQNGLQWENGLLLENGILQAASAKLNELGGNPFYKNVRVEAKNTPAVVVGHRVAETHTGVYLQFIDCTLIAGAGHPKVLVADGANPWFAHFIRSGVTPDDIQFLNQPGNEGSEILIDHEDGRKWVIRIQNGQKIVTTR